MSLKAPHPPRPRVTPRVVAYPRLAAGSVVVVLGMGLANSCGGGDPGYSNVQPADAGAPDSDSPDSRGAAHPTVDDDADR